MRGREELNENIRLKTQNGHEAEGVCVCVCVIHVCHRKIQNK